MIIPREDKGCYVSTAQREVLMGLAGHPDVAKDFFLTGGTCLSVFYLHHRVSEDLDLFTRNPVPLSEIGFWIKSRWPGETVPIRETAEFLSLLIDTVKTQGGLMEFPTARLRGARRFCFKTGPKFAHRVLRSAGRSELGRSMVRDASRVLGAP